MVEFDFKLQKERSKKKKKITMISESGELGCCS